VRTNPFAAKELPAMSQLLNPIQAAALSPRHAAQLRQIDGMIFQASGCKYRLSSDFVNVDEVNAAIRNAPIDTRMHIKAGLRALGLIEA
jgi:hypothetical protein